MAAALALSVLLAGGCGDDSQRSGATAEAKQPETGDTATPDAPQPETGDTATPEMPAAPEPTPVGDSSPEETEPSEDIGWEDLENLAFDSSGQSIQLSGGRAEVSYGGASTDIYTLQNKVTVGDIDSDGDDDAVALVIENSAGTGVFYLIVPVINDDGVAAALPAVSVGDRIVMESILVREGRVQVTLFDRAQDESFTVITQRKTLEIDLAGPEPAVQVVATEPIDDLPLPGPELPDIDVRFEPGAVIASVPGSIEFRQRQTYTLQAAAGQALTATLRAPIGIWVDVRLGDEVIAAASERRQQVQATLPTAGPWQVTVVSTHSGPAEYELELEALPLGAQPAPTSTTSAPTPQPASTADRSGTVVFLTFDDGPNPTYTPQVLDILARHNARATFFVLGSLVQAYPDLVDRIVAEGHTVANHTWNHENLAGLPRSSFDDTIGRTQAALTDHATPCVRPPYGSIDAFTREWAAAAGLDLVLWTVDTNDWRRPGPTVIADRIVGGATDRAIVLMHDGGGNRTQTVGGLEIALERLSGQGLRFDPICT